MEVSRIIKLVRFVVDHLCAKEYEKLVDFDFMKRLSASEIKTAIEEYAGVLSLSPETGYHDIDYYRGNDKSEVNLDFDLWFDNQKSDLTLKVKIINRESEYIYAILDIRVL